MVTTRTSFEVEELEHFDIGVLDWIYISIPGNVSLL
jgi:hypothetical protein